VHRHDTVRGGHRVEVSSGRPRTQKWSRYPAAMAAVASVGVCGGRHCAVCSASTHRVHCDADVITRARPSSSSRRMVHLVTIPSAGAAGWPDKRHRQSQ
jgi:hypothetical protein